MKITLINIKKKLPTIEYNITLPASEKKLDPSPVMYPSCFESIADDVIECAKPVVGMIIPDRNFAISLSITPIDVNNDDKPIINIVIHDLIIIFLNPNTYLNKIYINSDTNPIKPPIKNDLR